MSVVNQFGKLFNRKPEESDTGLGADVIGGGQNVLTTGSIEGNTMRESYQTDAMNSVQGDPDGVSSELSTTDADEDLISLPLLGSTTPMASNASKFRWWPAAVLPPSSWLLPVSR